MMMTFDQFASQQKAAMDSFFALANTAFQGAEKLVELNVRASKALLDDAATHAQAVLSSKDMQSLLAVQASAIQPSAEKAMAYSRHVYEISTGTTAEFTKAAEAQTEDMRAKFADFVDTAVKNAPAGSDAAMTFVKNAFTSASATSEAMQHAMKQATAQAHGAMTSMAEQATAVAKPAAKKR
jgi:phasin family protein